MKRALEASWRTRRVLVSSRFSLKACGDDTVKMISSAPSQSARVTGRRSSQTRHCFLLPMKHTSGWSAWPWSQ